MPERTSGLSRRDFNKLVGLGLIGVATLPIEYTFYRNIDGYLNGSELSLLKDIKYVQKLPADLYGVNFNAPYLWKRTAQTIDDFVYMARHTNGYTEKEDTLHTVRILPDTPDSPLEDRMGYINTAQIENLKGFVDYLPDDFRVIIPIIDGYWIFRSNIKNPMYPPSVLDSPYVDASSNKSVFNSQMAFFLSDGPMKSYKQRIDAVVDTFGQNTKVILEIGNEVAAPTVIDARHINSVWYAEMTSHFRQKYKRVLLTGLADPDLLDFNEFNDIENLVNTDHVYFPRVKKYVSNVPIIVEEIGVSRSMFGYDFNKADELLKHLMLGSVDNGIDNGVARVASVFIWHADRDHHDNLEFNVDTYPKTSELVSKLSPILRNFAYI